MWTQDEGESNILMDILNSTDDNEDLEIECDISDFSNLTDAFLEAEIVYAHAALMEPIDDPNEKDPRTIQEAEVSTYWLYWIAAIHEELESLKAKGVYEDIDELYIYLQNKRQ